MKNANTGLAIYDQLAAQNALEAVDQLGQWLASSGMFGCERLEQGRVLAMACFSERKNPLEIARTYHLIHGRLAMRADAMLAEFRNRGGKVIWKRTDKQAAVAEWKYDGTEIQLSFTIEDAKQAGLLPAKPGSAWNRYPDALLRARLISKAVRMLAPEVCAGAYTPEELHEIDTPPSPLKLASAETEPKVVPLSEEHMLARLKAIAARHGADVVKEAIKKVTKVEKFADMDPKDYPRLLKELEVA